VKEPNVPPKFLVDRSKERMFLVVVCKVCGHEEHIARSVWYKYADTITGVLESHTCVIPADENGAD